MGVVVVLMMVVGEDDRRGEDEDDGCGDDWIEMVDAGMMVAVIVAAEEGCGGYGLGLGMD